MIQLLEVNATTLFTSVKSWGVQKVSLFEFVPVLSAVHQWKAKPTPL